MESAPANPEGVPAPLADCATLLGFDFWMALVTQGGASRLRRSAYPGLCSFSLSGKDAADLFTVCLNCRSQPWLCRFVAPWLAVPRAFLATRRPLRRSPCPARRHPVPIHGADGAEVVRAASYSACLSSNSL